MEHRVTSHRVTFCYSTVDVAVAGAVDVAQGEVTTLQMAATHPTWAPVPPAPINWQLHNNCISPSLVWAPIHNYQISTIKDHQSLSQTLLLLFTQSGHSSTTTHQPLIINLSTCCKCGAAGCLVRFPNSLGHKRVGEPDYRLPYKDNLHQIRQCINQECIKCIAWCIV